MRQIKNIDKKKNIKILCYILCTLILSFVNQQKGSAGGMIQVIAPNFAIASLALFFLPSMKISDFRHKRYLIWVLINILATFVLTWQFHNLITEKYHIVQWYGGTLVLFIWGALFIRAISGIAEKINSGTKFSEILRDHWFQLIMSLALLMFGISINESLWPYQYLLVYTTMVLTDFETDDRILIVRSIVNGILISFFVIQGLAFVFRPYDDVRYRGMFSNPNINALFYLTVYCCFIVKYCDSLNNTDTKKKKMWSAVMLAFSGSIWSFTLLTGSRCTIIAMGFVTLLTGAFLLKRLKKELIKNAIILVAQLLIWIAVSFPLVFGAVRYLPALFHHPIWFSGEYSESKVHSYDPWDSDKYIDLTEMLANNYSRFFKISTVENIQQSLEESTPISNDSVSIRAVIYREYLYNLNMLGHPNGGLHVSDNLYAHAQNLYLMMAFYYGIPAGIAFMIFTIAYPIIGCVIVLKGYSDNGYIISLLFSVIFFLGLIVFGQFEMMWLCGELPFTLLFVLPAIVPVKQH